ncbi:hypothetical protein AAVH_16005 [Aphelenchoides avenae]|nr:hypothetical protein AAVH_16005 [Aphelenchus avenae]
MYQNAQGEWEYDESDLQTIHRGRMTSPFSLTLDVCFDDKQFGKWVESARKKRLDVYLEELGTLIHDAVDFVELTLPFPMITNSLRDKAKDLGFSGTEMALQYLGEDDERDQTIIELGEKFQLHMRSLMCKVRANDHSEVIDGLLPELLQLRQWLDRSWTRDAKKDKERYSLDDWVTYSSKEGGGFEGSRHS